MAVWIWEQQLVFWGDECNQNLLYERISKNVVFKKEKRSNVLVASATQCFGGKRGPLRLFDLQASGQAGGGCPRHSSQSRI